MIAAGGVRRANPPPVRPRWPTSRPATCIGPVRPANDARPAWAIRWAAAVTPQYPLHEAVRRWSASADEPEAANR
jgi:hypothetical protein